MYTYLLKKSCHKKVKCQGYQNRQVVIGHEKKGNVMYEVDLELDKCPAHLNPACGMSLCKGPEIRERT